MAGRIGQQFGNYRLLRLIGHGGFADVYLGEHIYMGTQAAIKVLHTQLGDKEVGRFREEASMVARLEHPHIVRVLEFGMEENTPYLVLSYAPNGTLRERYPKGTILSLPTIVDYVRQVADALQYAHNEKIIHRDIKPENMLLGRRNEILLSDFGIALIAQNSQSVKDLAGTAAYMAPEQIEAHPRPASDQYALGIIVYEWLSGACPFKGTFTEIALKHAITTPPSLSEKMPGFSPEIERVVFTALAKDPANRFASIQAFARALEQASHNLARESDSSDTPTLLIAPGTRSTGAFPPVQVPPTQPQIQPDLSPIETPPERGISGPIPKLTPFSPPTPLPPTVVSPAVALTPVHLTDPARQTDWPAGIAQGGPVTPLPVAVNTASDQPPPLKRRPSSRVVALLVALVILVIGGSVFGAIRIFQSSGTTAQQHGKNLSPLQAFETAIVNKQANHDQEVGAYNQNAATNGSMFGFDPQHTHANPYEAILSVQNIAAVQSVWVASLGSPVYFSSPTLVNGVVYIGTNNGKVYAFDAISSKLKWVVEAGTTGAAIVSSPAVADGIVYIGSKDSYIYAFDAITGHQKWIAQTGGPIFSSPTVVNGVVYIGSYDYKLHAFNARTGQPKWAAPTGAAITYSSPAVSNGMVYVGSNDKKLHAFDAATGIQKWVAQTRGLINSSPTVINNTVYIGSDDQNVYALNAITGQRKWTAPTGNHVFSSPAVANGVVYVGSFDGKLYAFDMATGQPKWVSSVGDIIEASPIVANGLVYVGSWDHKAYAFDASTGQKKWVVQTGNKIYSSLLVANGVVYTGSSDGKLYAFALAS